MRDLQVVVGRREVDALQARLAVAMQILAEVADGAAGRQRDADEHLHRGRLAGAVWSEQSDDLALRHAEAHAIDGPKRAVQFGEVADLERRCSKQGSQV